MDDPSDDQFEVKHSHNLRPRKQNYKIDRSRRPSSTDQFYQGLCESPPGKKARSTKKTGLSEPSVSRINSQQHIDLSNISKKAGVPKKHQSTTYPIIKPATNKKTHVKSEKLEGDTDNIPGIDIPEIPVVKNERVITCSLKTTTFGLKKQPPKKRLCSYRCPVCKEQFRRLAFLNDHNKNTHPPIICENCTKEFCMPGALERHAYLHKSLEYTCTICDKRFPFASDLKQHKISHAKVKTHHCTQKNCDRSFFNKGDLSKHMLTHSGKRWKCQLCDYTSKDQRNLNNMQSIVQVPQTTLKTLTLQNIPCQTGVKNYYGPAYTTTGESKPQILRTFDPDGL